MGLFDNFGEKFQDVAKKSGELAQKTAKKSGELLEITKLNLKIKEEENGIGERYKEIGKFIFEKMDVSAQRPELPEELEELIDLIYVKKKAIEELKQKIEEIKKAEVQKETLDPNMGTETEEEK